MSCYRMAPVLDGEITVTDEKGRPDFEAVMELFMSNKSKQEISFTEFDNLYLNDADEIFNEAFTD
jgi:ATP-dependent DNA ligase